MFSCGWTPNPANTGDFLFFASITVQLNSRTQNRATQNLYPYRPTARTKPTNQTNISTNMSDLSTATASKDDLNSENALVGELSNDVGLNEVEILGMELFFRDGSSVLENVSNVDFSDETVMNDPGNVRESVGLCDAAPRRRHPVQPRTARVHFPIDEVDSLILARESLPHVPRDMLEGSKCYLERLFQEGKGLMGERDSLILDRMRLPHLRTNDVQDTSSPNATLSSKRNPTYVSIHQCYEVPLNDLTNREAKDATLPAVPDSTRRMTSTGLGLRMTSPGACAA